MDFEATSKSTSTNENVSCGWLSLKNDLNSVTVEASACKRVRESEEWSKYYMYEYVCV